MGIVVFMEPATWNDKQLDDLSTRVDDGFNRIDAHIVRVETGMRDGFAQVDTEIKAGFACVDGEMKEGFARVDREMKEGFARVDGEMKEGFACVDREVKVGFARVDREMKDSSERLDTEMKSVREDLGGFRAELRAHDRESREFKTETYSRFNHLDASIGNLKNVMIAFCGTMLATMGAGIVAIVLRTGP